MTTVLMSGCMTVAKTTGSVAALPFKATYHTGKAVGKGVIGTGKAVYYVGSVPVKITDKALDTSIKVLTVTTKMVDLSGKVVTVSRQIQASQLEAELSGLSRATNVLSVVVDAYV
jgi:hypothetical protein